jgi:hypothetical protein
LISGQKIKEIILNKVLPLYVQEKKESALRIFISMNDSENKENTLLSMIESLSKEDPMNALDLLYMFDSKIASPQRNRAALFLVEAIVKQEPEQAYEIALSIDQPQLAARALMQIADIYQDNEEKLHLFARQALIKAFVDSPYNNDQVFFDLIKKLNLTNEAFSMAHTLNEKSAHRAVNCLIKKLEITESQQFLFKTNVQIDQLLSSLPNCNAKTALQEIVKILGLCKNCYLAGEVIKQAFLIAQKTPHLLFLLGPLTMRLLQYKNLDCSYYYPFVRYYAEKNELRCRSIAFRAAQAYASQCPSESDSSWLWFKLFKITLPINYPLSITFLNKIHKDSEKDFIDKVVIRLFNYSYDEAIAYASKTLSWKFEDGFDEARGVMFSVFEVVKEFDAQAALALAVRLVAEREFCDPNFELFDFYILQNDREKARQALEKVSIFADEKENPLHHQSMEGIRERCERYDIILNAAFMKKLDAQPTVTENIPFWEKFLNTLNEETDVNDRWEAARMTDLLNHKPALKNDGALCLKILKLLDLEP